MNKKELNERKFIHWDTLASGGRKYWYDIKGRSGFFARYVKEVDAEENTLRFYQEIYNMNSELIEIHEKYPIDKGHKKL